MHQEYFSVNTIFQSLCFYQNFHDGGLLPTRKLLIISSGKAEACRSRKDILCSFMRYHRIWDAICKMSNMKNVKSQKYQELVTHKRLPPVFSRVHVAQTLIFCVVVMWPLFAFCPICWPLYCPPFD